MFISILSRLLSAWFAFLLPCYATFKALSNRPLLEPDLHKLSMYWATIGAFVAFEYTLEWSISWLPFYWELKTLFLLFLSLPQTQGSTYIYTTYLQPFFSKNERDLDAGLVAMQRNVLAFIQAKATSLWDLFWTMATGTHPSNQGPPSAQRTSLPPQLARFVSADTVKSAMAYFSASSSAASAPQQLNVPSQPNSGPSTPGRSTPPPPFPVPQHSYSSGQ
ncbi:hypothetical protein D9619_002888 [Psilocybe cf. subviscida]|uniref:Protein YOP1 n=1 Tax=Psilocybe cf. subviscida TaxID=2480587 RepID=A0A8H5AXR4_9AGAR|nr:hypothetical protein D9619_002888 [Psilocybe cf. subviscida]